jgi:hypothetical protein
MTELLNRTTGKSGKYSNLEAAKRKVRRDRQTNPEWRDWFIRDGNQVLRSFVAAKHCGINGFRYDAIHWREFKIKPMKRAA